MKITLKYTGHDVGHDMVEHALERANERGLKHKDSIRTVTDEYDYELEKDLAKETTEDILRVAYELGLLSRDPVEQHLLDYLREHCTVVVEADEEAPKTRRSDQNGNLPIIAYFVDGPLKNQTRWIPSRMDCEYFVVGHRCRYTPSYPLDNASDGDLPVWVYKLDTT